ncbi:MAG TPA: GntR family transcriptional regulator [Holophaga sp.]|nr:GntR family transcriptional regulator [Holophaga sp.]
MVSSRTLSPILQTRSLREQVYEYLRDEMNRGGLQPGAFLDLNDLAQRLGISRTPLREALLQLESQGFVTVLPRRGFRLNPLTLDDIRHYYEIIGALESAALKIVGSTLDSRDLLRMHQLDDGMAQAVAASDFDKYYTLNVAFHEVYLGRCDNARMLAQINLLKQRLYDWPRRKGMNQSWEERSIQEHERFISHLDKGQVQEAANFLQDVHWSFKVQEEFIHLYYFSPEL